MGEYLRDESPKRGGKSARLEGCTGAELDQDKVVLRVFLKPHRKVFWKG